MMTSELPDANNIKLIAVDLDGTLLNSKGEVTERTITVIKKVLEKYPHLHFVINSGRGRPGTNDIREKLEIINKPNTELILLNGCIIYDSDGKIIWQDTLPSEFVVKYYELLKSYSNDNFSYACEDDTIAFNEFCEKMGREEFHERTLLVNVDDYTKRVENGEVNVNKICFLVTNLKEGKEIQLKAEELIKEYNLDYAYSEDVFYEYMPHLANKGNALTQLIKRLNIKKDEVLSFGDGGNDLEFFKNSGWPVAMANSCEELKPLARLTTKSNEEDGVAYMLEQIFLK